MLLPGKPTPRAPGCSGAASRTAQAPEPHANLLAGARRESCVSTARYLRRVCFLVIQPGEPWRIAMLLALVKLLGFSPGRWAGGQEAW